MTGYFITLEGGEGAGKTSVLSSLAASLRELGYDVLTTREPGGVEVAEKIRETIMDLSHGDMDPRTEALLFAAARRQHLIEKVLPALQEGKIVLCDRFIDSSLAYQGYARGVGIEEVLTINRFAIEDCMPGLTILFQIDPVEGLKRISSSENREQNRLDRENVHFHERVHEAYQLLLESYPGRIRPVDAGQSPEMLLQAVLAEIKFYLQSLKREGSK